MQDVLSYLSRLNRPRLLVRAARIGANDYNREVHLPRLINIATLPKNADALLKLSDIESEINERRLREDAGYSLTRHIDVLIAIVAEARILRNAKSTPRLQQQPRKNLLDQIKASGSASFLRRTKSSSASETPGSNAGC